ncbi:MAG TPA: phosphatidate cytidylyltransferase [Xanthomonadaceae bacterium]|nr:phosphatidate cytidylyltransferase [Xanthomonadaceae bacterium]
MKQRIVTAVVLFPIAVAAVLLLPTPWMMTLIAAVMLAGLWEWGRLSGLGDRTLRAAWLAAHAAVMAWLAWYGWPDLFPWIALIGALWWLLAALWLGHYEFASRPGRRNRALKLGAGTLAGIPAWAGFALLHGDGALGPRWALLACAIVWAADMSAFFAGRQFGGPKLAPRVSPNKTWSGLAGGLAGALLLGIAVMPLLQVPWGQIGTMLLLVLATTLASVVGDLFESLIKRHSGAKDSGVMVPGHGGMLDRIDSTLAALAVFAVGKAWLDL